MKTIVSLSKPYISVNGSFGGSQNFFKKQPGFFNKNKMMGGCGIVSMGDVISYLKGEWFFENEKDYRRYFNRICRRTFWLPSAFGMTFLHETFGMIKLLRSEKLPFRCRWNFSRKDLAAKISYMLKNDIPVILCIPRTYGPKETKKKLAMYNDKLEYVESTNGHFVVVTGVVRENDTTYLKISSWGKVYLISFDEYMRMLKTTFMGLLGNILYIKHK